MHCLRSRSCSTEAEKTTAKLTNDKAMKTVHVYDFKTKKANTIPAAELAPGMVRVNLVGVGEVYVKASDISRDGEYKHPPFNSKLRNLIKDKIQQPLAETRPLTLEQWEDGFRRDNNAEREIAVWVFLADRFTKFSKAENLNRVQRQECFKVMLGYTIDQAHVLETITLSALTRDQAQRAIEAMSRDESK